MKTSHDTKLDFHGQMVKSCTKVKSERDIYLSLRHNQHKLDYPPCLYQAVYNSVQVRKYSEFEIKITQLEANTMAFVSSIGLAEYDGYFLMLHAIKGMLLAASLLL